jgi:hypothetical protein
MAQAAYGALIAQAQVPPPPPQPINGIAVRQSPMEVAAYSVRIASLEMQQQQQINDCMAARGWTPVY